MKLNVYTFKCPKCEYSIDLVRPWFATVPLATCSRCLLDKAELIPLLLINSIECVSKGDALTSSGNSDGSSGVKLGPHPNIKDDGEFSWSNSFNRKS